MADPRDKPTDGKDTARFTDLVGEVKPIRSDKVEIQRPKPPPVPLQTRRDETRVMEELLTRPIDYDDAHPGDVVNYHRPGVQKAVMRKLRRGQYAVEAELDLHGLTAVGARAALARFVRDTAGAGVSCVRIIHGKGNRSSNRGPVIKPLTVHWLAQCNLVLAFTSARPVDGGTGALYVLLRRR